MDVKLALDFLDNNCQPCNKCRYHEKSSDGCSRPKDKGKELLPCDAHLICVDMLKRFIEEKTK